MPPSAASILAAARAKASTPVCDSVLAEGSQGSNFGLFNSACKKDAAGTEDRQESPKLKRKTKTAANLGPSHLAKLVESVSTKPLEDAALLPLSAFASNYSPDDFWKNLREWDFVADLARHQVNQSSSETTEPELAKKGLPETFISGVGSLHHRVRSSKRPWSGVKWSGVEWNRGMCEKSTVVVCQVNL